MTLFTLLAPAVAAAQETLEKLADRVVEELHGKQNKTFFPRIIVADFPMESGQVTALSEVVADKFSEVLVQRLGLSAVLDRKNLHDLLRSDMLSPNDVREPGIANWLFGEIKANAAIRGRITVYADHLQLSVELRRVADDKRIANADASLPLTEEWTALAKQPLEWPPAEQPLDGPTPVEIAVPCATNPKDTKAKFEAAGVKQPTCAKCRMPEYTDAARKDKAQGNVKMTAVVDVTGRAQAIHVIQGAGYGFVERSVEALRSWRFNPATRDGKPVAVCVVIETTFRLF